MVKIKPIPPINQEEKVAWVFITWTYGLYLLGLLYASLPALVWWLGWRHFQYHRHKARPLFIFVWWNMAFLMLLALIIGHVQFDLGLPMLFKSSVGWAKGWALFAVLIGVGASGMIRPELLARAACHLCFFTLCLIPFLQAAILLNLPPQLYVSPMFLIGGPGPDFFSVDLYRESPDGGGPRLMFFAPWAPAISMVANVLFWLTRYESEKHLRHLATISVILIIIYSGARLGFIALLGSLLLTNIIKNRNQPKLYLILAIIIWISSFFTEEIFNLIDSISEAFTSIRADSSRVRSILASIAVNRWYQEAFWFGHGNVELGPHLVEFMPIGSHHTWYGLLFIKGFIGFIGLFIAIATTIFWLSRNVKNNKIQEISLGLLIALIFYSFGENLEILAYLVWPGWIFIGIALKKESGENP